MLPTLLITLLAVLNSGGYDSDRYFETQIMEVRTVEDLQDPEEREPPPERPDDLDVDINVDSPNVDVTNPVDRPQYSPQPQAFDAVLNVKSPVILRGIYGDIRNTGARGSAMNRYGGNEKTEAAVMRALRWLKKNQSADGSWGADKPAMTALAVLTFLAHNEKPGDSEEFGPTVQKALEYLISRQNNDGLFTGRDGHDYTHPIVSYALCEAYGMTLNPNVKTVAEKALVHIINGQKPSGGWDYNMETNPDSPDRDDTSYMGWCAQALKAAKLANIPASGLEPAMRKAVGGFKKNAAPGGGFGYTSPGVEGMTAIGALCLQLLGAADAREVKLALDVMKTWKPSFDATEPSLRIRNNNPQYYYYYATQAKFHNETSDKAGWTKWFNEISTVYVAEQKIQKNAIKDMQGRDCDIGWWENKDNNIGSAGNRPVMDTCLAALQLMTPYRYLPTTSETAVKVVEEIAATPGETDDIKINVVDL
jgi:hypothetical protein